MQQSRTVVRHGTESMGKKMKWGIGGLLKKEEGELGFEISRFILFFFRVYVPHQKTLSYEKRKKNWKELE